MPPSVTQAVETQPAVLIRLRPLGPWRFGTGEGGDHRLDTLFRSDRLYSAVTLAMQELGFLEEWLDATARAETPVASFSSLFPFQADTLFAPPPTSCWPPPAAQLTSPSPGFVAKMRWEAVRFIPLGLVETLITGQQLLADQWAVDAESGCLLRRDRPSQSPFRFSSRPRVAVDRLTSVSGQADNAACVEFENGSGLWLTVRFANADASQMWSDRLHGAFRVLADTGFGGRRRVGWGQTAEPDWQTGTWPTLLLPKVGRNANDEKGQASFYWLLSLYSPALSDQINWKSGDYRVTLRSGRVESRVGSGALKKTIRMITEGSVLSVLNAPVGTAVDVAPDGFPHPVYRSGLALALRLPALRETSDEPAETTPSDGILEVNRHVTPEVSIDSPMQSDVADEDQPVSEPQSPSEPERAIEPEALSSHLRAPEQEGMLENEIAADTGQAESIGSNLDQPARAEPVAIDVPAEMGPVGGPQQPNDLGPETEVEAEATSEPSSSPELQPEESTTRQQGERPINEV